MGRRKKSEALPPPRFTKEEYEKLVTNGKAIEQYIRKEILPKLPTVIWLEFGNKVNDPNNSSRKFDCHLELSGDTIRGGLNGKHLYFGDLPENLKKWSKMNSLYIDKEERENPPWIDLYDDIYIGAEFLYQLCIEWKDVVKPALNVIADYRNRRIQKSKEVFESFEV